jgi:hypothetical protein
MDRRGLCINCLRVRLRTPPPGTAHYVCVFCSCPFPDGQPHRKCLRLMGARAARGQSGPLTYWRKRAYWPKNKGRAGRTVYT